MSETQSDMPKITVQPSGPFTFKVPLIREALIEKYDCEVVKSKGDLYIEDHHSWIPQAYYQADSSLYFATESAVRMASRFNVLNGWIKRHFSRSLSVDNAPKFLLGNSKRVRFPSLGELIERLAVPKPLPRKYAVMSNDCAGPNLLSLPFFLQYYRPNEFATSLHTGDPGGKRFCCAVISNLHCADRINFIQQLSRYKQVDIFGRTPYTNSTSPHFTPVRVEQDRTTVQHVTLSRNNADLFANYKFVVCFENSIGSEYVTEKLPSAMLSSAIPVYKGAPNVSEYFNTDAFVNYEDHGSSFKKMIKRIAELDQDDQQYSAMAKAAPSTSAQLNHMNAKLAAVDELFARMVQEVRARKAETATPSA